MIIRADDVDDVSVDEDALDVFVDEMVSFYNVHAGEHAERPEIDSWNYVFQHLGALYSFDNKNVSEAFKHVESEIGRWIILRRASKEFRKDFKPSGLHGSYNVTVDSSRTTEELQSFLFYVLEDRGYFTEDDSVKLESRYA